MRNNYRRALFLFIFLLITPILYAQQSQVKKPLTEILIALEQQFKCRFTYANDVVQGVSITKPAEDLTLPQTINHLRRETNLIFTFLDDNIITINNQNKSFYISGYITDNETKIPLESATITGKNTSTTSNETGLFQLKISNLNEIVSIRYLGYKPVTLRAHMLFNEKGSNIFLDPRIESLTEIILPNYIAKGIHKISNGSLDINFSNFDILPGLIETDVLQTVQALPGILSINETVSNISIRGGTNDQNLILWDGIKMYQSGHFFGLISAFNPLITHNVSVVKNGSGADFTDGISGTISMHTDSKITDQFTGSFGANFINADTFADIPISESSSLQISARKTLSNLITEPTYSNYFNRILQDTEVQNTTDQIINSSIKFDFYDTSLRWLYNATDNDQIRVNFINIANELKFNESGVIGALEDSKESTLEQNNIAYGLFYKRDWNKRLQSSIQLYHTDYELEATNVYILNQRQYFK